MKHVSDYQLWVGNIGDLRDVRAVLNAGIEAVIELADNETFAVLPRELVRCRFPLSDGGDNPTWLLRLAVDTVAVLLKQNIPVLVCCSAGMSRSVCIAAGGLSLAVGSPLIESLKLVVETGPSDVSPGLLAQLHQALATA